MSRTPSPSGPSWRSAPTRSESAPPPGPRWRSEPATPRPDRVNRSRTILVALGFLFLLAAVLWVCLWFWPPGPTGLVLLGAGYEDNLAVPHNVYGRNALAQIADWARSGGAHLHGEPRELRTTTDWDIDLAKVRERTILLFLALHGGVDSQGAYLLTQNALLPNNGEPRDETKEKLRLAEVIDRLARIPDKNVVLILDATQLDAHWPLGMLHNDFARELDRLNQRIAENPHLIVLSASGPDQRSWVCEEWRQTAFGHYLLEGLKGAATRDHRLNAAALYEYVAEHVSRWARDNRNALQTPVLLPHGEEGLRRARGIHLAWVSGYTPAAADPGPAFQPPELLTEAWKKYLLLEGQNPAPWVYAPQLWTTYQAATLRYEQLLRAGDAAAASKMTARLAELEQEIQRAQYVTLASASNSLPMTAVTGRSLPPPARYEAVLAQLWTAEPKELAKKWEELQKGLDPQARQWQRLRLSELLLKRAADDPAGNLARSVELLHRIDDAASPRPAEAHFLAMLRRDLLNPPPPAELLAEALRVRVQAERAALGLGDADEPTDYSYCEEVAPRVAAKVREADESRRLGEDLLFMQEKSQRDAAASYLQKAKLLYTSAQQDAAVVRRALATRDHVLQILPAYSHSLAGQRLPEGKVKRRLDTEMLDSARGLWQEVHALGQLLATPGGAENKPQALARQSEAVRVAFDALRTSLEKQWEVLDRVEGPEVWRDIDDALAAPIPDNGLRMRLLTSQRRIARRILIDSAARPGSAPPVSEQTNRERAQWEAARQGRLALQAVGQPWFEQTQQPQNEKFSQVEHRLEHFVVEENWWQSLRIAGAEIAARRQQMTTRIEAIQRGLKEVDPAKAPALLSEAARLTRQLDVPGAMAVRQDPVREWRLLQVQNLLLRQAGRTLDDHWFAEAPADPPYYRVSGLAYVADAQRLRAPLPEGKDLAKRLSEPSYLRIALLAASGMPKVGEASPTLHLTSEQDFRLTYQLQKVGADVPPGFPVVWVDPGNNLVDILPKQQERLLRKLGTPAETLPFRCVITSPLLDEVKRPLTPKAVETTYTVRGLFRGQQITEPTRIVLHPLPEQTEFAYPLPPRGSIAVRAPAGLQQQFGVSNATVAIILDCSGSMGPREGQPFTASTKYAEATAALRAVLGNLPRGTRVSLWVFGQAVGAEKTVEAAEQTIRQIQPPTPWNPDDPLQLRNLMAKVEYPAMQPWNESPILHAMIRAAAADFRNATGFKTLLVLTDGMDNRFAKDRKFNPAKKALKTVLREVFEPSDIEINIVGFKFATGEEKTAREQFQVIEQFPVRGRFFSVNDSAALVAVLDKAMRPRLRYWIDREDNRPLSESEQGGLDVSTDTSNDKWLPSGLAPGGYKVRVQTNRPVAKNIAINAGDLLLVELLPGRGVDRGTGALTFERVLYSQADQGFRPFRERSGWRWALLQNQRVRDTGLQMLWTLEKKSSGDESTLQQIRPIKTWMELAAEGGTPFAQAWHYQPGYPAPAWGLDVPAWSVRQGSQAPAPATARVWWNADRETLPSATLRRGPDFAAPLDLENRVLPMDEGDAVLESVRIEEHVVTTAPGRREVKTCLVVRLRHDPKNPVWVQFRGVSPAGHEHRWYQSANKYTGVFWFVNADEAVQALTQLDVLSLERFKRQAVQRQCFLEMRDLAAAQPNDDRPLPAFDLYRMPDGAVPPLPQVSDGPVLPSRPLILPPPRPAGP
jgi:hypothetical protein